MSVLPEVVVSPRLVLRRWRPGDAVILRDAVKTNIDHLRPWMSWIASEPLSDGDREDLIRSWEDDWVGAGDVVLGTFLGEQVVGGCGLHRRAGPEILEIGYWVHVDHLQRGYATEMARALTTAALGVPGIGRVEIHHDKANTRSRGVPEALDFCFDGESPREFRAPAEIGIDVAWSMTADLWQTSTYSSPLPEYAAMGFSVRDAGNADICGIAPRSPVKGAIRLG